MRLLWERMRASEGMKPGALDHIKMHKLMARLSIPRYQAVGIMESLWHFAAGHCDDGNLSRYQAGDVAAWIQYADDAEELWTALSECGWLEAHDDGSVWIHDWADHAPHWLRDRWRKRGFVPGVSTEPPGNSRNLRGDSCAPLPSPCDLVLVDKVDGAKFGQDEIEETRHRAKAICGDVGLRVEEDRDLILKVATLIVARSISEDMAQQAVGATVRANPKNRRSYFHKCMSNQCKQHGLKFNQLLKVCIPPPSLNGGGK